MFCNISNSFCIACLLVSSNCTYHFFKIVIGWLKLCDCLKHMPTMQWFKRSLSASAIIASKANLSLSYSHSPSKFPMLGETFGQRLEWAVNKVPERDAFVFPKLNVRYTFAQYLQNVFMFITYLFYVYHVCIVFVLSNIVVFISRHLAGGHCCGGTESTRCTAWRSCGPVGRQHARVDLVARGRSARRRVAGKSASGLQVGRDRVHP